MTIALPTLTQIRRWHVGHLDAAADAWTARARAWERSYVTVAGQIWHPGGTPWRGVAADAAAQRVVADRRVVIGAVDLLSDAAETARVGATEIRAARQVALQKIAAARGAGFYVEDDLSIGDVTTSRQADAEVHARSIWRAADALVAVDDKVARGITEAAKGLQDLWFPVGDDGEWPQTLLAGYDGLKAPIPAAPHLIYCYPSARPDFWWCEGFGIEGGPYGFDSPWDLSGVA
jgi:hypothetical protein